VSLAIAASNLVASLARPGALIIVHN